MLRLLLLTALLGFGWQCKDRTNTVLAPSPTPTPIAVEVRQDCYQLALMAFKQHMQPAIENSCGRAGCHATDARGNATPSGLELLGGDGNVTTNHTTMRAYRNGYLIEDGVLLDKISDQILHEGGDQIAQGHITPQSIAAWLEVEQNCALGRL